MEQTSLVKAQAAPLAVAHEGVIPGLESMDRGDMIIPRLRLVQAQSQFSDAAGQLHNSLTDTAKPFVHCVIIGVKKGRVMWPADFSRGQDPACASDNGINARDGFYGRDVDGDTTTDCGLCMYGVWAEDGNPPPCSALYNFLAVDVDEGDVPFLASFGRTSARAGKQLVTLLKTFGLKRSIVLATEQQTNDKGKYYVLTVKPGDLLDADRQGHYASMARAFSGVAITSDTEAEAAYAANSGAEEPVPF